MSNLSVNELKNIFVKFINNKKRIDEINDEIKKLKTLENDINEDMKYLMDDNKVNEIETEKIHFQIKEKTIYQPVNNDYTKKICLKLFNNNEDITNKLLEKFNEREVVEVTKLKVKIPKKK